MTDDLAAQVRLLESGLSNLNVRMALVESKIATADTAQVHADAQARSNNVPTRVALIEEKVGGLNRLMWIILVAILSSAVATNLQLFLGMHK